jgi:plasmid stabilization system protein ParE
MAKKIIWTPQSKINRLNILEFYFDMGTPKKALIKIDNRLKKIILHLSRFPGLGKEFGIYKERIIYKDNFAIVYKVENKTILILHLQDCRRDPKTLPYG